MHSITLMLVLSMLAGGATGPAAAQPPHTHQHSFGDAGKYLADRAKRE